MVRGDIMFSICQGDSGGLLSAAIALSIALAQGKNQSQIAKLGALFTIAGDVLSLFALQPDLLSSVNLNTPESPPCGPPPSDSPPPKAGEASPGPAPS